MCEPTTIAVAMGVGQAASTIAGQRNAAKTQEKMQLRATQDEQKRYLREVSAQRTQERFQKIAMAQKLRANQKRAMEARATARVVAGEAGVGGRSVDALVADYTRKEAEYNFSLAQQDQMNFVNSQINLDNAAGQSRSNMLRINKPIEQPNYLGAILDGAQTAFSMQGAMADAGFTGFGNKDSVATFAKQSQKTQNMGMLDLHLPNQNPFNTYG
tara:strand:+ start:4502 stop:5143 length:642 start_codon:yes stop_codon:yes gene_type:complete